MLYTIVTHGEASLSIWVFFAMYSDRILWNVMVKILHWEVVLCRTERLSSRDSCEQFL